jgi:hypothetical protein
MTARPRAWVLNLEADDERARGPGWTPSRALRSRLDELTERLTRSPLFGPDDVRIERDAPRVLGPDYDGAAWSPTDRAKSLWRRAGVRTTETPAASVLSRVSSRAFTQGLRAVEPRERRVDRESLGSADFPAGSMRISLSHTCAGRGHWWVEGSAHARATIARLLARHAEVFVAERVEIEQEFALHGWIGRGPSLTLGLPTEQRVDPRTGSWIETRLARDLSDAEREALAAYAREAASALGREGYFGPFGIDAFRFRDREGRVRFCPRSELNARYTMGWAVGMSLGESRPSDLLR